MNDEEPKLNHNSPVRVEIKHTPTEQLITFRLGPGESIVFQQWPDGPEMRLANERQRRFEITPSDELFGVELLRRLCILQEHNAEVLRYILALNPNTALRHGSSTLGDVPTPVNSVLDLLSVLTRLNSDGNGRFVIEGPVHRIDRIRFDEG